MKTNRSWSIAAIALVVLAGISIALAQDGKQLKLRGTINDFTPATVSGPWEIRGDWNLHVNWETNKAEFTAAVTMERSDQGVIMNGGGDFVTPAGRHAHTHHITLANANVTPLSNGFRVTGTATVAGNGGKPPDFGVSSPVQVDITGGSLVQYSNIKLTFGSPADTHFGDNPFSGVVRHTDSDTER